MGQNSKTSAGVLGALFVVMFLTPVGSEASLLKIFKTNKQSSPKKWTITRLKALQSRLVSDKTQHIYISNAQRPHAGVTTQRVTHPEYTAKHT